MKTIPPAQWILAGCLIGTAAWSPAAVKMDLTVEEPAQVEPWLDAFFAIDARRWRQQGQAWIRARAARWRGDGGAAALWTARLRTLARWSLEPGAGELTQQLRL